MITGTVVYRPFGQERGYTYQIEGYDTSDVLSFYMTSSSYNAVTMMAYPDQTKDDPDLLWERAVEIKMTKINVQTNTILSNAGKKAKAAVNADLFCALGALIRYVKTQCTAFNEEGYTGLRLASAEFEPSASKNYIIHFPMDESKVLARATLEYGNIINLSVKTNIFTIEFAQDRSRPDRVFYRPKNAWTSGFEFNKDYLGFDVPVVKPVATHSDGMYHNIQEVIEAHPDKNLSWLFDMDYHIVTDETLEETCKYLMDADGYVYYDTETTGLNINFLSRVGQADQCVGVILSRKYGEDFFFPLQMNTIKNLCNGDHWYVMEHYLRPILESKPLVAHNMSFDWKVGYIYGINCNIVHDTMAILQLTYAEEIKDYKVGLKENAKLLLGRDSLDLSDLIISNAWGENDITFNELPEELVRYYACSDTDNTNGLLGYLLQNDVLGKYNANKVYEIEIAFSYAVAYQEFYGHHIDIKNLNEMRKELGAKQEECMNQMVAIVGHSFNPNSSAQLQQVMYKELGIPEQISRKTGRVTTDKESLSHLAELTDAEDNIKYPFCVLLKEYRELEGVRKIIDKFPEHMTQDGYIFSSVMQYGTTTGRVSINSPNYQSYNDPVKKNVVPRPGFYMTDCDYSSIEYRVLGNMVGNERIMKNFEDPDFDYHTYQASHMYNVPYSAVTKKLRKAAKGINFGLPYGMGDESLGVRIFGEESEENTRKAAALRAAYFKGQEDIRDWFDYNRSKGVSQGYTETYFGRRRYYRSSQFSVNAIKRQAGNMIIQGCLDGATQVVTKEYGVVKIGSIAGQQVTVWDGEDWTRGMAVYSGKKELCRVHFEDGRVFECSPTHKFRVLRDGIENWVPCRYLQEGDAVLVTDESAGTFDKEAVKKGIVLGRLASDGMLDNGTGRAKWFIDDDETDVIDKLISYLHPAEISVSETLDCITITDERLRGITCAFPDDINILRGYLAGYFDGACEFEGGKLILQGGDILRDIQKSLLLFGVRSIVEDGVLTVVDTSLFRDRIGLLGMRNFSKLIDICDEESEVKRVVTIANVEMTKEFIDMYDICNTDRGYYVADGLVVHNSAADIYKIAVGRIFKRICREGWLGKVLLSGFIHDELLAEVSNDINPGIWLKTLREEFEVKVYNDDGSPWCPLYMGFGYGMSWYEAKSVELPIKLQWELVQTVGDKGFPDWDGNGRAFCDKIPDMLRDFEVRDIRNQITDPEAQGKEIKASLNTQVLDCVKTDAKEYGEFFKNFKGNIDDANVCSELDKACHIQGLYYVDGEPVPYFKPASSTQEALDQYCMLHNVDRKSVNLLDIEDYEISGNPSVELDEEDKAPQEDGLQRAKDARIDQLGMYLDTVDGTVTLLVLQNKYMQYIKEHSNMTGDGYQIYFKDSMGILNPNCKGQLYETKSYLSSKEVQVIQQMYLSYFNGAVV